MREKQDRKQSNKLTSQAFKNSNFWKQDITPDGKSFITHSEHMFWSNEMFLKANDIFLFLGKELALIWDVDYAGSVFVNTVSLKSNKQ